ncbi:hypothetical protein Ddep01_03227 [Deinococcus depolymerans]
MNAASQDFFCPLPEVSKLCLLLIGQPVKSTLCIALLCKKNYGVQQAQVFFNAIHVQLTVRQAL